MKKRIIIFIVSLTVFCLIISCSECDCTTDPFDGEPTCYVYDANGNPVQGAKILCTFDLNLYDSTGAIIDQMEVMDNQNLNDSIEVDYTVVNSTLMQVWVANDNDDNERLVYLVNDATPIPGSYTIYWDKKNSEGKYVENGAYRLYIYGNSQDSPWYKNIVLTFNYDTALEDEIIYLTSTDEEGRFHMADISIPFYEEALMVDSPEVVYGYYRYSKYFKLWAVKDGMDNFYLDSVSAYDNEVVIRP